MNFIPEVIFPFHLSMHEFLFEFAVLFLGLFYFFLRFYGKIVKFFIEMLVLDNELI